MKFPKEYFFLIIVGLFLLSYVLEAVVDPLALKLSSPYAYLSPVYFSKFPFSSAVIGIRAIAFFLIPMFVFSFFSKSFYAKATILLLLGGLMQLYSLQEVATGTTLAPLEWSLSLSVAGLTLALPTIFYFIRGMWDGVKNKIDSLGENYPAEE